MDLDLDNLMSHLDYTSLVSAALLHPPAVELLPNALSRLHLAYADIHGWRPLRLDLHLPTPTRTSNAPPVVVYVHGGSFLTGMPVMGPWTSLPTRGIAVASISYRLAGEAQFPEPIEDVRAALRWITDNANSLGVDGTRLALWGSSAGAYLAAAAALAGSRDIGRRVGGSETEPHVSGVVCHYGVFEPSRLREDARHSTEDEIAALEAVMMAFFGSLDPSTAVSKLAGPDPIPPFLLMHGDSDTRVGLAQSHRFAAELAARGVPAELVVVEGADHGSAEFESPANITAVEHFLRRVWQ